MAINVPQTIGVKEYAEYIGHKEQKLGDTKYRYPSSYAVKTALEELEVPELERVPIDWTAS